MALFKKEQFDKLAKEEGKYCISIYIPTNRNGENKESMIRLKNEVAEIEKKLAGFGLKPKEVDEYIRPLKQLTEDTGFWRHLSDALMVFRSKEMFEHYTLPLQVQESSQISDRFYLLPLINIFNKDNRFFILLLSLKKNRFYEATQHEITEIVTDDIFPEDIYDSAGHDVVQKSLQYRSEQTAGGYGLYHGKGEGKDDHNTEIMKYLEDVDKGLNQLLEGYDIPVVVAAVESLFAHFREVSNCKNIYPKCVPGNQDNGDILLIHEKAKELLEPYFDKVKNEKKEKYAEANGKTTSSVEDVVISADAGSIDTLFIARGKQVWGRYNKNSGTIDVHEKQEAFDNSLLDLAARKTFYTGGKVFIENQDNLPENNAPVNAILRF